MLDRPDHFGRLSDRARTGLVDLLVHELANAREAALAIGADESDIEDILQARGRRLRAAAAVRQNLVGHALAAAFAAYPREPVKAAAGSAGGCRHDDLGIDRSEQ